MANKVKGRKMDTYTISGQRWELDYVAHKFKCGLSLVQQAKKECGKSRQKCYRFIKMMLAKGK